METVAKAFLSYAHDDNEREGGRILELASQIMHEFETLTGTTIEIFTDKAEILWGQDFHARLDEALQETTFFIPILTPTYFLREECRKEMRQFVTSATALGLDQLLLSIRYTTVPDLREGSADELKDIAARMQFEPWDGLRLLDETSMPYRTAVNKLATRLVGLTERLESGGRGRSQTEPGAELIGSPAPAYRAPTAAVEVAETEGFPPEKSEPGDEDDDAPGLIDLVEDVEPAMAEFTNTLSELGPATLRFNALFEASAEEMNRANERPNSFAAKIVIARQLASDIEEALSEIEQLSKKYSMGLLRLDPGIRALLEMVSQAEGDERTAFIESLQGLIVAGTETMANVRTAADAARANSGLSRDLRPVLRRFETAMRNIADGSQIMRGWQDLTDAPA